MSLSHVYKNPGCCNWLEKPRVVLERKGCIQGLLVGIFKTGVETPWHKREQSYLLSLDWLPGCLRSAGTSQQAPAASLWLEVSLPRMSPTWESSHLSAPRHTLPARLQAGVRAQWIHLVPRVCGHSCWQKRGLQSPKAQVKHKTYARAKVTRLGGTDELQKEWGTLFSDYRLKSTIP